MLFMLNPRVLYRGILPEAGGLVVERFANYSQAGLMDLALSIAQLRINAYSQQLEPPNGPLPRGHIAKVLTPETEAAVSRRSSARVLGQYGAVFIGHPANDPTNICGLVSLLPFDAEDQEGNTSYCQYIPDILAHPAGQGIGSAVLHAAAVSDGYRHPDGTCFLDGYRDSPVNNWYERLGFVRGPQVDVIQFGDIGIPTDRYGVSCLRSIIPILESAHPALQS